MFTTTTLAAAGEVAYTLPAAGRVSLAVYDSAGRQVRTLLSAEPQKAGRQAVTWDGLDREGKPLPAGQYLWKLVQSPGIKAEYLLSLGTSVGIHHWPGQHGGPDMVARDGDAIIVGGTPEGSPLLAKIKLDGTYLWAAPNPEPTSSGDMAGDGARLYCLLANSRVHVFSTADGKRLQRANGQGAMSYALFAPIRALESVAPTRDKTRTLDIPVPVADGSYLLRVKAGPATAANPFLAATVQGQWTGFHNAKPGEFKTLLVPEVYSTPRPVEAKAGKLVVKLECLDKAPDVTWSVPEMELVAPASRIDARDGAVAVLFASGETVAWVEPDQGTLLFQAKVPGARDVALLSADELLVATDKQVVKLRRGQAGSTVVIDGLVEPVRLSVERASGHVWLAEAGPSQQVKCFGPDFRRQHVFGRHGGRRPGLYKPEDFLAVADIIGDGHGGFIVVESQSAPRRTAHFDREGKLIREWYGGQQFYTFAAPEPENPSRVWMDSQWNWLMQVDVDYARRTWKVRACYEWTRDLDPLIFRNGKMAGRMYPFRADRSRIRENSDSPAASPKSHDFSYPSASTAGRRTADGQPQDYLWFQGSGLVMRIDEAGGRMLPVACLNRMIPNQFWNWHEVPPELYPQAFKDALAARGKDYRKRDDVKGHLGFGWADANGDGRVQGDELRLLPPEVHKNGHGFHGGPPCLWIDGQMRIYAAAPGPDRPAYEVRSPVGRTPCGAPVWDWASPTEAGPQLPFSGSRMLRADASGNLYQLLDGGGDGFAAGLDPFHSHGANWPGTLVDRTAVVKYSPQGAVLWRAGNHAARFEAPAGRVHNPACIAGFADGCVGVCDYFVKPCHFWTEDGLCVGELLDGRADDGLPQRVYSWWRADREKGDEFESNLALFQYDMLVGGSLAKLPGGEVVFLGAGWNNVPVYRVHGLDRLARQQGTVEIGAGAIAAAGTGGGLQAEYFAVPEPAGEAGVKRVDARIWFGAKPPPGAAQQSWPPITPAQNEFSARWTGLIEPRFTEDYVLATYLRGKARVFVSGVPMLDRWDKPAVNEKLFAEPIPLQAGRKYPLVVEFASAGVDKPEIHLCWESPSQGIEHIPASALYSDPPPSHLPVIALEPTEQAAEKGGRPVGLTVRRTGPTDRALAVRYAVKGDAGADDHYRRLDGRIEIPAGTETARIAIVPLDNRKPELMKTLVAALLPDPAYQVRSDHSRGTVYLYDHRAKAIPGAKVLDASGAGAKAASVLVEAAGLDLSKPVPTHDCDPQHMWLSGGWTVDAEWVVIDLGAVYDLTGLRLWNYNVAGLEKPGVPRTNHGVKELEILAGEERDRLVSCGVLTVAEAPGKPDYTGQLLSLPVRARFVRLHPKRSYAQHGPAGVPSVGIAKVLFYGQPLNAE